MRYIDADGKEQRLEGVGSYLEAVQSGRLMGDTMVFDESASKWVRADSTTEYRSLKAGRTVDGAAEEAKKARLFQILGWLALLAAFLLPLLVGSLLGIAAGRLGERFGQSIVLVGVVAISVAIVFRKSRPFVKHGVFLAVMVTFLGYNLYGVYEGLIVKQEDEKAKAALTDAIQQLDRVKSLGATNTPNAVTAPSESTGLGQTSAAFIAKLPQFQQRGLALVNDFQNALITLQMEEVLSPERAVTKTGIEANRAAITKYERLVDEYDKAWKALQAALRAEAETVRGPEQQEFLQGFTTSSKTQHQIQSEWLQIQKGMIREMRIIMDICAKHLGRTSVKNGLVMFEDPSDVPSFNAALTKVHQYAKQEEDLLAKKARIDGEAMKRLRELTLSR